MDKIVIASRESRLAMWQAEHIRSRLQALYPGLTVEILGMTTQGDQILDKTLAKIGGKGLFVKELEVALQEGRADLAVHSIKDVPMVLPQGFALAAICTREDPRDALVSNRYQNLAQLPHGAVVGTSSLRREAQLRARFPHLTIRPLRGNVQTRLAKLDNGDYDAIILAAAGLKRLGLGERIAALIEADDSLPAAGQGALGIEIRADRSDLHALLAPLNDADSHACVSAERALAREMGGSCQLPLGAFATLREDILTLTGLLAHPDGSVILRAEASAPRDYAEALGRAVAKKLDEQDARSLIADILQQQA
ncbi:hydroxymethylbilane synthase [Paludibacterium sp. THUN1379]|uniref:hydroxymethylbilane synthase n=1 Tax=Paludibacterium sp. THUN1379 TaxID=3112107 RepID=UPI0030936205|nr:hydroxymethylbilane synthase [Paludibacterium sp. THUN1379]